MRLKHTAIAQMTQERTITLYSIFEPIKNHFMNVPKADYDATAHAKFVRIRKAAYEANYWLEAGTREV